MNPKLVPLFLYLSTYITISYLWGAIFSIKQNVKKKTNEWENFLK